MSDGDGEMARTRQDVTETELAVLQSLWEGGPATIRQLTDALYPGGTAAQYATVQKLLDRLEAKECVCRDRTQPAHTFSAAIAREELIGRRLQDMAERLCGGSLTPVLTHLVRTRQLSARERQDLRELIDELASKGKGKGKGKREGH
jgi:BlaI family penicillinase repressor